LSCRSDHAASQPDEFARRNDTDFAYEIKGLALSAPTCSDRKAAAPFRVIPAKILTPKSSACRRTSSKV
jgi:hypothetical protein